MINSTEYSLGSLAKLLELEFEGEADTVVSGLATLVSAQQGQLSFYTNSRFLPELQSCQASAIIIHPRDSNKYSGNKLLSQNPYLTYAQASQLFNPAATQLGHSTKTTVHASAVVAESAKVGKNTRVMANAVIGEQVVIGDGVSIGANCVIADDCVIGDDCVLHANVTIYDKACIGNSVIIHSSAVIGADGFGYASDGKEYHKIAQLGSVTIADNVEIGAGTCIDRGALDDTQIGAGVKIDNQVQIAHNVKVGANTIICGCSAIAGSSTIGKNCIIAGGVGVINNVNVADGVTVTAMSLVNQDIKGKGIYSSGTGLSETSVWKKNIVRFRQLDTISKRLHELESNKK